MLSDSEASIRILQNILLTHCFLTSASLTQHDKLFLINSSKKLYLHFQNILYYFE